MRDSARRRRESAHQELVTHRQVGRRRVHKGTSNEDSGSHLLRGDPVEGGRIPEAYEVAMMGRALLHEKVGRLRLLVWLSAGACCLVIGCGDRACRPSAEELTRFQMAGPSGPTVNMDRVAQARMPTGPYRLVPGDVVRLQMPGTLGAQLPGGAAPSDGMATYDCRIHDDGTIVLPVVGRVAAAGRSLAELESAVIAEYYPKYVATLPPIHASVMEYKARRVSIMGSVGRPGIYNLRHDQATLVSLLMEAGGIADRGAAVIRIIHSRPADLQSVSSYFQDPAPRRKGMQEPSAFVTLAASTGPTVYSASRAVFTQEAPLNTSGWLAFEQGGRVVVRRWIDLASESQVRAYLQAVAAVSRQTTAEELQTRLSGLATYLDHRSQSRDRGLVPAAVHWNAMGNAQFVTDLPGAGSGRISTGRMVDEVSPSGGGSSDTATTLVLPVHGLNVPFADVALEDGDSVVVEPPATQFISVVGLVRTPGNFPYPPDARYDLIQAVALAGGLDLVAAPRYVSVYRLNADGVVVGVRVQLVNPKRDRQLTETLALPLKPGDVVSVEHTPRTRTNVFLDRAFRINLGLYFDPDNLWNNNG
jgi:protein involved in polysaccharide export with SLBB domain